MMIHSYQRVGAVVWALALVAGGVACGAQGEAPDETGQSEDAVLGGLPATSPVFDAVGAVYGVGGPQVPFCTATLIAPDQILGSISCMPVAEGGQTTFRVGARADQPKQTVAVRRWVGMYDNLWSKPGPDGGRAPSALSQGLAIGYLDRPLTITPLPVGNFKRAGIGRRYIVMGYGEQSDRPGFVADAGPGVPPSIVGRRRLGSMTLRALEGDRFWETQYKTFDDYVTADAVISGTPSKAGDPAYRAQHLASWEERLTDADAVLGGGPGDAASSGAGDTGAPILGVLNGKLTILGLSSTNRYLGPRPGFNPAHVPVIAATFGSEATYFLGSRKACGQISAYGDCAADKIVRCTTPNEGAPRLIETDCAEIGFQCGSFGTFFNRPNAPRQCIPGCETNADCAGIVGTPGTCKAGRCTWASVP